MPIGTPSLYCKTAPPYVTTKSGNKTNLPNPPPHCFCVSLSNLWGSFLCIIDDLMPLILVELTFAVAVSSLEADIIVQTIDRLIREHLLPEKSDVR